MGCFVRGGKNGMGCLSKVTVAQYCVYNCKVKSNLCSILDQARIGKSRVY